MKMTTRKLEKLRSEIRLGSIFYDDYKNSFGFDEHKVCDFFDGFLDYINELYSEEYGESIYDNDDKIAEYDNIYNLWEWWNCFETNPF